MIRSVGPALAVAIGVTLLAGLTLTPAYLGLFGRFLFWPFHRRFRSRDGRRGPWAALARALIRRPVAATVALVALLAVAALAMPMLRADFNMLSELPPGSDGGPGTWSSPSTSTRAAIAADRARRGAGARPGLRGVAGPAPSHP